MLISRELHLCLQELNNRVCDVLLNSQCLTNMYGISSKNCVLTCMPCNCWVCQIPALHGINNLLGSQTVKSCQIPTFLYQKHKNKTNQKIVKDSVFFHNSPQNSGFDKDRERDDAHGGIDFIFQRLCCMTRHLTRSMVSP